MEEGPGYTGTTGWGSPGYPGPRSTGWGSPGWPGGPTWPYMEPRWPIWPYMALYGPGYTSVAPGMTSHGPQSVEREATWARRALGVRDGSTARYLLEYYGMGVVLPGYLLGTTGWGTTGREYYLGTAWVLREGSTTWVRPGSTGGRRRSWVRPGSTGWEYPGYYLACTPSRSLRGTTWQYPIP